MLLLVFRKSGKSEYRALEKLEQAGLAGETDKRFSLDLYIFSPTIF